MKTDLAAASGALLPAEQLPALGWLRARGDVHALLDGDRLWLAWAAPDVELASRLLTLSGVSLLCWRQGCWHVLGHDLPLFGAPSSRLEQQGGPLSALLAPAMFTPAPAGPPAWQPLALALVPSDEPRPTSALLVSFAELARWAETATSDQLSGLQASACEGRVLLRGRLPAALLRGVERFWGGGRVLLPAGWRLEPAVSETVLAEALRLGGDEGDVALLLLEGGFEVVPGASFGPVSRAGIRRAAAAAAARMKTEAGE